MHLSLKHLSRATLAAAFTVALIATPLAFAEDGGGSSGGGGGGSSGGSSGGGGSGGGGKGGHSGHGMDAIIKATLYTAKSSYPNVFHRFNTPFTGSAPSMDGDEKAFLCSMSRMHFEDANMRTWFEKYLASVLGRTATEIHDAMSKKSCKK